MLEMRTDRNVMNFSDRKIFAPKAEYNLFNYCVRKHRQHRIAGSMLGMGFRDCVLFCYGLLTAGGNPSLPNWTIYNLDALIEHVLSMRMVGWSFLPNMCKIVQMCYTRLWTASDDRVSQPVNGLLSNLWFLDWVSLIYVIILLTHSPTRVGAILLECTCRIICFAFVSRVRFAFQKSI